MSAEPGAFPAPSEHGWRRRLAPAFAAEARLLRAAAGRLAILAPPPATARRTGILAYHRVAEIADGLPAPTWNVTPATLRRQLEELLARGFVAVPLRDLVAGQAPAGSFAVTFDDGYENFLTAAAPVLRALGVPATLFLATGHLGSGRPFPFDDWAAAGSPDVPAASWRPLGLDQCAALAAEPLFQLAAHGHAHRDFRGRPQEFAADLRACLAFLEERLGIRSPPFAFPFGAADPELLRLARSAGAAAALTMDERRVVPGSAPFGWGRFLVRAGDSGATLAGCLGGWQDRLGRYRRRRQLAPAG